MSTNWKLDFSDAAGLIAAALRDDTATLVTAAHGLDPDEARDLLVSVCQLASLAIKADANAWPAQHEDDLVPSWSLILATARHAHRSDTPVDDERQGGESE